MVRARDVHIARVYASQDKAEVAFRGNKPGINAWRRDLLSPSIEKRNKTRNTIGTNYYRVTRITQIDRIVRGKEPRRRRAGADTRAKRNLISCESVYTSFDNAITPINSNQRTGIN